jgi:hypothetical protein
MKLKLASALMAAVFVAACGGGGGGGSDTLLAGDPPASAPPPSGSPPPSPPPSSPPPPPSSPPPSGPIATSATYEAIDYVVSRTALTAQANAQGARGFSLYSGLVLDDNPLAAGGEIFTNLYAKESNTTFSYESLDLPTTRQTLLAQLNAQGARGFAWYSALSSGTDQYSFFVKESSVSSVSYEFLDETTTSASFLSQVNAQGARGFIYSGAYIAGGSTFNIYGKVNGINAQYNFRLDSVPTTQAALITQANAQGQSGYAFSGAQIFTGEPINAQRIFHLYVKDTTQNSTFEWRNLPVAGTPAALVSQANSQGSEGFRLFGNYGTTLGSATTFGTLYAKGNNCTGVLCRVNSLF